MRIGTPAASSGFRLQTFESVASTNDIALESARAGDPGNLWIVAEQQTGGRGRLGRHWVSPPGNLHASLLLIAPCPMARAPELGFVAGVALASALEALGVPADALKLKWPNDALLRGAKLSGALLEATTTPAGAFACVVGLGVNCVAHPDGLPYRATDLAAEGFAISREKMFEALSDALITQLDVWAEGAGFDAVRAAWLTRAAGLGSRVEVSSGEGRRAGLFKTIDAQGRLILIEGGEEFALSAGDVLLPD